VLSRPGASEPGRLRHRLTLEKPTPIPDGAGGFTIEWASAGTFAADVTPLRGDERRIGEGLSEVATHRIVLRHRDDVEGGDRMRLGERLFRVKSVTDPDEDGRYLVCLAEEEKG
jgi:SPP1 family predicted phage head-tail adaptor